MERHFTSSLIDLRLQGDDVQTTREVKFVISTSARDRHRTVLNMDGWKLDNFNNNPIVGYQHNVYGDNMCQPDNPDNVLGPGRAWTEVVDGKRVLMGAVRFETEDINPLADKIFKKVLNGTLRSTSVGFLEMGQGKYGEGDEKRGGAKETYYFDGQELLEFSIVNIPSNPEARARSTRHQTQNALGFLARLIPNLSIDQIRDMKVADIIALVEAGDSGEELRIQEEKKELEKQRVREMLESMRAVDQLQIDSMTKF